MMLGIALLFIAFIMLKYVPYSEFLQDFNMDGYWILLKVFLSLSDSLCLGQRENNSHMRGLETG